MYCKNCGAEIKENAGFCGNCGIPVVSNKSQLPNQQQVPNQSRYDQIMMMELEEQKRKKKRNIIIIVLLVCILALAAGTVATVFIYQKFFAGAEDEAEESDKDKDSEGEDEETDEDADSKDEEPEDEKEEFDSQGETEVDSGTESTDITQAGTESATTTGAGNGAANVTDTQTEAEQPQDVTAIHTYQFVIKDVSWTQAYQEAMQIENGYLVNINTDAEMNEIVRLIQEQGLDSSIFWIGGMRMGESTDYHWIDKEGNTVGEVINNNSSWLTGEPTFRDETLNTEEKYMNLFYVGSEEKFIWNDTVNELVTLVPSYSGRVGYIVEIENE